MQIVKISLAEQARNALLAEIISGQLPAGCRLTEEAISKNYRISRTPVREALRRLENDGLIKLLPGRGYQVKKLDVRDVDELLSCRMEVEMKIFSENHANIAMDELQKLCSELQLLEPASPDALAETRRIDDALHNIINAACRNRYWQDIHRKLLCQRLPYRDMRNNGDPSQVARLKNERLKLLQAILSGDPVRGAAALHDHLESGRQDVLTALPKAESGNQPNNP